MITESDILKYQLGRASMRLVEKHANLACIGGSSAVRKNRSEREKFLKEDQVIGQIGQLILSKWLTGNDLAYRQSRWVANKNPTVGDNGSDILAANIDVKASLVKSSSKNLMDYNLLVRPRELHKNWVYILVLVTELILEKKAITYLMGWATEKEFPKKPEESGVFMGSFVLPARQLNPLPPFRWML